MIYRSSGVDFHRGRGLQPEFDFLVVLLDKLPITEKVSDQIEFSLQIHVATMYPIITKPVNTNIRHLLSISCPSRPRCRIQLRPLVPELGWPALHGHLKLQNLMCCISSVVV